MTFSAKSTYYGANFGYHWFWDYFNLFLGANVKNSSLPSETKTTSSTGFGTSTTTTKFTSTSGTLSGLEFSIGLKF